MNAAFLCRDRASIGYFSRTISNAVSIRLVHEYVKTLAFPFPSYEIEISKHDDSMASSPTPLPPGAVPSGQAAPVEVINATHHGGWVVITAALGLTFGIVCLLIRLYVRLIINPPFTRDDYVHSVATVSLDTLFYAECDMLTPSRLSLSFNLSWYSLRSQKVLVPRLSCSVKGT